VRVHVPSSNGLVSCYQFSSYCSISNLSLCVAQGAFKRKLVRYLPPGRRPRNVRLSHRSIQDLIGIDERPAEAEDRTVPEHWEGTCLWAMRSRPRYEDKQDVDRQETGR
jgi:hypothetical protein